MSQSVTLLHHGLVPDLLALVIQPCTRWTPRRSIKPSQWFISLGLIVVVSQKLAFKMSLALRTHNINHNSRFFQQLAAAPPAPSPLPINSANSLPHSLSSSTFEPIQNVQERREDEWLVEEESEVTQGGLSFAPCVSSPKTTSSRKFNPLYPLSERWRWISDSPIVNLDEMFLSGASAILSAQNVD